MFAVIETKPSDLPKDSIYARQANAERVFRRKVSKETRDAVGSETFVRNLVKMPIGDLEVLDHVFTHYLNNVKPGLMALEGEFGWIGKGDDKVHRTIATIDGWPHDSREQAGAHTLRLLIEDTATRRLPYHPNEIAKFGGKTTLGMPKMSDGGICAMANEYFYSEATATEKSKTVKKYYFFNYIRPFLVANNRLTGKRIAKLDEQMAKAIKAVILALKTPVA